MNFGAPDRVYEPLELVPRDYFRHLERAELPGAGTAPLEVDLGCGDGSFLVDLAARCPARHFLGVERLLGRARKVARKAHRAGLGNVRVLRLESAYTIGWLLPGACVSRLHLLFPDPWPKKRHHKNRFVRPENIAAIERVLVPGGEFLFKTDHGGYFEWTRQVMAEHSVLAPVPWNDDDFAYPQTDFEQLWRGEGRSIHRIRYRKA